jgi:hypothetical protein
VRPGMPSTPNHSSAYITISSATALHALSNSP